MQGEEHSAAPADIGEIEACEPVDRVLRRVPETEREKAIRAYAEAYGLCAEKVRRAVYRVEYQIAD